MKLHPRLTRATLELVRRFETFQPVAEPTADGGWSIGYGHTRSARQGATVSQADAEALLMFDLDAAAHAVERAVFAPVTARQFEALVAFCFNVGEAAFLRSSALARLNAGAELDAADEIERWRRAELGSGAQVVDALVRRRAAEKAHFLGVPEGGAKWPSARLRPLPAEGGEAADPVAPPAMQGEGAPQATLHPTLAAAEGVQARLRQLIPEAEAYPVAPAALVTASAAIETDEAVATAAPADFETMAGPDEPLWEASPPPFDTPSPANDGPPEAELKPAVDAGPPPPERDAADPAVEPAPPPPAAPAPESPAMAAESPRPAPVLAAAPSQDRRAPFLVVGLLGLILFCAAAAMMIAGRPSLLNLALGVVGALLIVPGLYGALGPRHPAAPAGEAREG